MLREAGKRYFVFSKTGDDKDEDEHLVQQIFKTAEQLSVYIPEEWMHTSNHWKDRKWKEYSWEHSVGIRCLLCDRWTVVIDDDHTDSNILQRWHQVIDTPDVSNMDMRNTEQEIKEWQNLNPDIVLLAIRCDVRYTAEEFAILNEIRNVWGDNSLFSRLVVAFTFGDRLDGDIKDEVINVCKELQTVLRDCGERYVVFNSHGTDDDKKRQVGKSANPVHLDAKKIVLLGRCGSGKSVTGDIILGKQMLHSDEPTLATKYYFVDIDGLHLQLPTERSFAVAVFEHTRTQYDLTQQLRERNWAVLGHDRPGLMQSVRCQELDSDIVLFKTWERVLNNKLQEHFVLARRRRLPGKLNHRTTESERHERCEAASWQSVRNLAFRPEVFENIQKERRRKESLSEGTGEVLKNTHRSKLKRPSHGP
ncbi:hypothetical protein C0Q70_17300 [Pomacea canaliculata]|uniref:AIG1-type G domain-containing protein n=1 Tax=Pomacea canaliculata TaxID=400727 RepID=A0A2T7NSA4_POMCA|nr:hypothetical protein C0Q70_17300 [Pomacea canaliculata]